VPKEQMVVEQVRADEEFQRVIEYILHQIEFSRWTMDQYPDNYSFKTDYQCWIGYYLQIFSNNTFTPEMLTTLKSWSMQQQKWEIWKNQVII
jgi:hypothetical protein